MMVLSKANYSSEKQNLRMSSDVLSSIETAINAGKIVSTHTDEVTMGTWKGYGYIITDPSTGAAAYMISGGLSGGSSSDVVTLAYLVDIGFAIADIIEALRMIPTMLSFFSMGGPIGIAIGIVVAAIITATIIFAVMDFIESNRLMEAYLNGDEEAGKQLMTNMWINVGMAAGIKVIGVAGKAAVKSVAGKKVAKELGEEIAEKLLKNCDDPTAITKALKNLDKANVPKDTIKDIAESAGQEGLEWFGKQAKNGIKGNVLEKVFKNASDYTKYTDDILKKINSVDNYADNVIKCINNCGDDAIKVITDSSDELFERIAKSNGYADDIISCVKNYGDDAANAIVKHGDDAAIVISIYGKDAAEVVANASDELFERIMKSEGFAEDIISCVKKYGDDAANAIVKCGDDAVLIISEYGENAAKAISKYGDEAVGVINKYADDGLKALDNGIEPKTINEIADWNIKPDQYDKFEILDSTSAKEVASKGYNQAIVKDEFSTAIPKDYINNNSDLYGRYFELKKGGLSHQEINDKLLDEMLDSSSLNNKDKISVRKAVSDAYVNSSNIDSTVTKELFYDIKNGLVPYEPKVQFPNAYKEWSKQFDGKNNVACFVNTDTYNNIIEFWDAMGRPSIDGKDSALFVLNDNTAKNVVNESVDMKSLAINLGLKENNFEDGAFLITIDNSLINDLRYPTPDTSGANEWWVPGMQTSGGQFEAVIRRIEGVVGNKNIVIKEVIK